MKLTESQIYMVWLLLKYILSFPCCCCLCLCWLWKLFFLTKIYWKRLCKVLPLIVWKACFTVILFVFLGCRFFGNFFRLNIYMSLDFGILEPHSFSVNAKLIIGDSKILLTWFVWIPSFESRPMFSWILEVYQWSPIFFCWFVFFLPLLNIVLQVYKKLSWDYHDNPVSI